MKNTVLKYSACLTVSIVIKITDWISQGDWILKHFFKKKMKLNFWKSEIDFVYPHRYTHTQNHFSWYLIVLNKWSWIIVITNDSPPFFFLYFSILKLFINMVQIIKIFSFICQYRVLYLKNLKYMWK